MSFSLSFAYIHIYIWYIRVCGTWTNNQRISHRAGGGGKSSARKSKLRAKNEKLAEERAKLAKEDKKKKQKQNKDGQQQQQNGDENKEAGGEYSGIHPSRLNRMQG